jgi:hypothetical protein
MARGYLDPQQSLRTRAEWRRWEQVGLEPELDLDELVLNWPDQRVPDLEAKGAITGLQLERTIEGSSTVTITMRDPNGRVFGSGRTRERIDPRQARIRQAYKRTPVEVDEGWDPINAPNTIGRAMEVELDGVVFRLVQVRYAHASRELTLTFEDRIVYWLKRKRGAKRADRALCTRAQFILSLLREVRARNYRFVCPELLTVQPVDKPSTTAHGWGRHAMAAVQLGRAAVSTSTAAEVEPDSAGGFARGARLTVKGKAATPAQRRRMEGICNEARALGASDTVMAGCIAAATQESVMGESAGTTGNDDTGLYQQGRNWINAGDTMDPRKTTRAFLTGAINGGGAKGWKQIHGSLVRTPGGFEAAIKRVQVSVGGYGQWQRESERTVAAFQGTGAGSSGASEWQAKRYQFTRNSDESSWQAMQRLAQEVGWRLFVVGNSVYFMSEQALYARRPRYEVQPDNPAVLDLSYDVDWGKAVSEASLTVALDRWGAAPGSVITLDGWGPPDGRWLVVSVSRDWFSPTATVSLKQPGKALLEPANERVQRSTGATGSEGADVDAGSRAGQVYQAAKAISDRGYPYVWGGGHSRAGTPDRGTGRDPGIGYDCSGSVCAALAAAGLGYRTGGPVDASGAMASGWGQPGRGRQLTVWANGGHVWMQFHGIGSAERFDTSPYGSGPRGPHLRSTERPTAGFVARHWPGV